jgi:lipoprotein-anchoring transpeptidase ErfK/SrfK
MAGLVSDRRDAGEEARDPTAHGAIAKRPGHEGRPGKSDRRARSVLWSGNKDTLYRIHGTNEPWTIGTNVSSGCIRLTNEDIVDLYNRARVGTKVVVLSTAAPAATGALPFRVNSLIR